MRAQPTDEEPAEGISNMNEEYFQHTDEEPAKGISNVVRRFFTNLNTGRWATKQHYAHACSSKKRNKRGVCKSQLGVGGLGGG